MTINSDDLAIHILLTCFLAWVLGVVRGLVLASGFDKEEEHEFYSVSSVLWPIAALVGAGVFLFDRKTLQLDKKFVRIAYTPLIILVGYLYLGFAYTKELPFLPISKAIVDHNTPVEFSNISKIILSKDASTAWIYFKGSKGYYSPKVIETTRPKEVRVYENAESPGIYSFDKRTRVLSLYLGKNTQMRGFTYK